MQVTTNNVPTAVYTAQQDYSVQQSASVSNIEKVAELFKEAAKTSAQQSGLTKKAMESAIKLLKDSADPVETLKRILTSKPFSELNISASPELQNAFKAFLKAINMNDSQILDALKFQGEHQTKYAGVFFDELSSLLEQFPDSHLKTAVSTLLRAYDCYFTTDNDDAAAQSFLQKIMAEIAKNTSKTIFDYLGDTLITSSNTDHLPEKVKNILSQLAEQLADNSITQPKTLPVSTEPVVYTKNSEEKLQSLLSSYLEKQTPVDRTEVSIYKALSIFHSEKEESISQLQNALSQLETTLPKNAKAELEQLIKQISEKTFSKQEQSFLLFIKEKLLPILEKNASSPQTAAVYKEVDQLIQQETKQFLFTHRQTAATLSSCPDSNTIYTQLAQRLIENKANYNVDVLKNEILPQLLQNKTPALEQNLMQLTQSLVRVNDGLPEHTWQAVQNLFTSLEKNQISLKDILQLRLNFLETIQNTVSEKNEPIDCFINFLQTGIQSSSSNAGKNAFQDLLWSLLLKNNVNLPTQYFFLPIQYGNICMVSEIWKAFKKYTQIEEEENGEQKEVTKDVYKLFLTFDIQNIGYFESSIFYSDRNFAVELSVPDSLKKYKETIRQNIRSIIENNHMTVGSMVFLDETEHTKPEKIINTLLQ